MVANKPRNLGHWRNTCLYDSNQTLHIINLRDQNHNYSLLARVLKYTYMVKGILRSIQESGNIQERNCFFLVLIIYCYVTNHYKTSDLLKQFIIISYNIIGQEFR